MNERFNIIGLKIFPVLPLVVGKFTLRHSVSPFQVL